MIRVMLTKPGEFVIDQTEIPTPGKGEILLKVERCGVCGSDPTIYRGLHPYAKKSLVMGHEFSGTIETLGENVKHLKKGMRVTVIPHVVCGKCKQCLSETYNFCEELKCMGAEADGAHVNFVNVDAKMVMPIPDNMSMEDAAMVEPACVGYHGAKRGDIVAGDIALVVGAGPIGVFTMQSAKVLGAAKVIIADMDQWRLNLAKDLGADGTINVGEETLEQGLTRILGNAKDVDVFYDCVGEKGKVFDAILSIARRGTRIVMIGVLQTEYLIPHLPDFVQHELRISGTTMYVPQDYKDMIRLMSEGKISTKGMITHHAKLTEIKEVFKMIDSRKEPYLKIMLTYD
jgi:L-iditol 2-dehydrogenase